MLIRARYLAQFLPEHEYLKSQVLLQSGTDSLLARGKQILARGWKAVIDESHGDEAGEQAQRLPTLGESAAVALTDATVVAQRTQPPKAYTEGTLVKAMKAIANQVADPRLKQSSKTVAGWVPRRLARRSSGPDRTRISDQEETQPGGIGRSPHLD